MTLIEAITKFDSEYRNTLPKSLKLDWLSLLDHTVYKDIILTHQNTNKVSFSPYTNDTPDNTVLIVEDPFSDIYITFLAMKKDLYYSDISKYNNNSMLFRLAYSDYKNYYNRTNLPIKQTENFNV